MVKGLFIALLIVLKGITALSQVKADEEENHAKHEHHHNHEIGLAASPVYFFEEDEFSAGMHFHYIYNFPHSRFGAGAGFERLFDEHGHNTVLLIAGYRLTERIHLNLSPGIAFEDEHSDELKFALHVEGSYDFQLGDFHLGPLVEMAYDTEDYHVSLGLHIGIGF